MGCRDLKTADGAAWRSVASSNGTSRTLIAPDGTDISYEHDADGNRTAYRAPARGIEGTVTRVPRSAGDTTTATTRAKVPTH